MELKPKDDAAKVNLGIEWQMPTEEQFEELINSDYTTSEWTQLNGVDGTKITSKSNGESIFLPAAGFQNDTRHISDGVIGQYWSRSVSIGFSYVNAYILYIRSGGPFWSMESREGGKSIRPVRAPEPVLVEQIVLNETSLSLLPGIEAMLTATVLPENADDKDVRWESSNPAVATVWPNGMLVQVDAIGEGTCTITCYATDGSGVYVECQVTVSSVDKSGSIDGKDYIDLGLPSGTLWATCNIGANSPEQYGDYIAWGETQPKEKYYNYTYTFTDNPTELPAENDAATVNWGANWQMPSKTQIDELSDSRYTTSEWTQVNGVYGRKITSKINSNSIFLPAAGHRWGQSLRDAGSEGRYWSRSIRENITTACVLIVPSDDDGTYWKGMDREDGLTIRPVRKQ